MTELDGLSTVLLYTWGATLEHTGLEGMNFSDEDKVWIWLVIIELVKNCVEKVNDEDGVGRGAKSVSINLNFPGRTLVVEDNFIHSDPTHALGIIENIKFSGQPLTTKPIPSEDGGGLGLLMCVKLLAKHRGVLEHRVEEGRIVAEARWDY